MSAYFLITRVHLQKESRLNQIFMALMGIQKRLTIAMAREDGNTMNRLGQNWRSRHGKNKQDFPELHCFLITVAIAGASEFDKMRGASSGIEKTLVIEPGQAAIVFK